MSTFDTEFSDKAVPELLEQYGETVTRHPEGDISEESGISITAIVDRMTPEVDLKAGRKVVRKVTLSVADTVACLVSDQWTVGGLRYQATVVGTPDSGLIEVLCQRTEEESRHKQSAGVL